MSRYLLIDRDQELVRRAVTLLQRITQAGLARPAQLVSVGRALHALQRMPQVADVGDLSLSAIGPRRHHGDIEVYFWWDVALEGGLVTIGSGGHFYRPSTGGDTFRTMAWQAYPDEPAELSDYREQLTIVPGLRSFLSDIPTVEELGAGFKLSVEDESNELLDAESDREDEEEEDDEASDDDQEADRSDEDTEGAAKCATLTQGDTQESTVRAATDRTAQQLVVSAIEWLQDQRSVLAGEDAGLGNLWLEFCAQVQGEHSVDWEEFESIVRQTVEGLVCERPAVERQALWLQTEAGRDWFDAASVDDVKVPVFLDDVVNDLYSKVWQRAADWEDVRLEAYLSQSGSDEYYEDDEEDSEEECDDEGEADEDEQPYEVDDEDSESADWVVSPRGDIEEALARQVDPAEVDAREAQFAHGVEECGICGTGLDDFGLMVDGRVKGSPMWGNLCPECFIAAGEGLGNGVGQLYARQPDGRWRLVAGFPT